MGLVVMLLVLRMFSILTWVVLVWCKASLQLCKCSLRGLFTGVHPITAILALGARFTLRTRRRSVVLLESIRVIIVLPLTLSLLSSTCSAFSFVPCFNWMDKLARM